MNQSVRIKSVGMVSALGVGAEANCAVMKLNYDGFVTTEFETPSNGKALIGAQIESSARGAKRLSEFVQLAISDALAGQSFADNSVMPIACIADENLAFCSDQTSEALSRLLVESSPRCLSQSWQIIAEGATGLVRAFEAARELLYESNQTSVLIVAVDSLLNNAALSYFLHGERIPGCRLLTDKNSDGFIPGEAAAAMLLEKPAEKPVPQLLCDGLGRGSEPAPIDTGKVTRADGMVTAVKQAVSEAGSMVSAMDFRLSNLTGEKYFFNEDSLMLYRTCRPVVEDQPLWHVADAVGETGAAAGAVMVCVAFWATAKNYAPGNNILLCLSSAEEARGAMMLRYTVAA
ncbi:MAG: hypothetical protein AB8G18_13455 [Gammaproteobacteria bacterium]